jgi:hypothetical protein
MFSKMGMDGQIDPRSSMSGGSKKIRMSGFSALLALEGFDNVFSMNPEFERPSRNGYTYVDADVKKMDDSWKNESDYYVGKDGVGGQDGRYKTVSDFVDRGSSVIMPEVSIRTSDGVVTFIDGRHRFAVLRDRGLKRIKVAVPNEKADEFKELYGYVPEDER